MKFGPVSVDAAEGAILAHSMTLPSSTLRKGHRLTSYDLDSIRDAGISSVIVASIEPTDIDENEAAGRLASWLTGKGVEARSAATGRVNLHAAAAGILVVDKAMVDALNAISPAITLATLPQFATVAAGQMVATVKIIPFALAGELVDTAAQMGVSGIILLKPFESRRVGLIQTELPSVKASVLNKTAGIMQTRLDRSGSRVTAEFRTAHAVEAVASAVTGLATDNDLVVIFGASAVCDEDDVIPAAIRLAGGLVERVGMPVDPGNLLVLGWLGEKPVIGAPGCARSPKLNGFDWVLDRLMADIPITSLEIARMGVGGLLMEIPSRPQPREQASKKKFRIDAILLAAGSARRMGGSNKLLSHFDNVPLVRKVAQEILRSSVTMTTAVTGHQADAIAAALDGLQIRIVFNGDHTTGMASSLRAGIATLPAASDGALICLGDMPGLEAGHFDRLVQAFVEARGTAIVRATSSGKPGNPVILPRSLFDAASGLSGDRGAKRLIDESGVNVVDVEIGAAAHLDVDTPEALAHAGGEITNR